MTKRLFYFSFGLAACLAGSVTTADAQTAPSAAQKMDARFNAWLGCWRLEDDIAGTGARMCITPDGAGVRLQTLVGTNRGIEELVIADGVARPIVDADCKGTEAAEWSNDGQRVFRTTQVTCGNEGARTIKSVAFLAPGPMWINVQHVSGESGAANVRAQRYRRAFNQTLADGSKAAPPAAGVPVGDTRWSIEDVIEASGKLPADALQAALSDVKQKFNVNRKTLLTLDEAGVPDSVIDLMVALTFPDRFIVERATGGSMPVGVSTGMGWYDPLMSPLWASAYASCYPTDGYYGYRSYYNMCGPYYYGYNYYSPYYPYYPPGGGWYPIDGGGGGGNIEPIESGTGRAINGRGYTQIRERSPEPTVSRTRSGGNGSAAGWSGTSNSGASSGGGYSSGSSGGSSGGSSSGGDSGRTAVARPPGGGN
jgi:hypothetical protein